MTIMAENEPEKDRLQEALELTQPQNYDPTDSKDETTKMALPRESRVNFPIT